MTVCLVAIAIFCLILAFVFGLSGNKSIVMGCPICLLFVLIFGFAAMFSLGSDTNKLTDQAKQAIYYGDYDRASKLLDDIPQNSEDYDYTSFMIYVGKTYKECLNACEQGDVDIASGLITKLKNINLESNEYHRLKPDLVNEYHDYLISIQSKEDYLWYTLASTLYNKNEYEKALDIFYKCADYEDSKDYIDKCKENIKN